MYHDMKHVPTQHQADIRRAIELERYGVVFALVAVLTLAFCH